MEAGMKRHGAIRTFTIGLAAGTASLSWSAPALADAANPYLGEIIYLGTNFCPRGYSAAAGQTLAISTNTALFSLLGTTYGGNGQTTFQLPDLRGRSAIGQGSGPGLTPVVLGEILGNETVSLTTNELFKHDHRGAIQTANAAANSTTSAGNAFGVSSNNSYENDTPPSGNFMDRALVQVQPTGGGQPVSNLPPYITLQACIALQGIFPSRN
jgi:microcystin-dependent protein